MEFTIEAGTFWALSFLYFILVAYCIRHYVRVYTTKQNQSPRRSSVVKNQKKSWAPFFYPMLMVGCLSMYIYTPLIYLSLKSLSRCSLSVALIYNCTSKRRVYAEQSWRFHPTSPNCGSAKHSPHFNFIFCLHDSIALLGATLPCRVSNCPLFLCTCYIFDK
jgi:hypothetical protein